MRPYIISGFADEIHPDLDRQIALLKSLSINHLELRSVGGRNIGDLGPEEIREIGKRLEDQGIFVSAVGSPIGKIRITDPFAPHFRQLEQIGEAAKILGTPYIRMFSFYIPAGDDPEQHRTEVFRRMERMVDFAREKGLILLHENEKGIYGDSPERCLALMERFHSQHFKAIFDFANFVQCGADTLAAYALLDPYIDYIHVKDALADGTVVPAGAGIGHVPEILQRLFDDDFTGCLSLEPHLTDFEGFARLEQGTREEKGGLSGAEAFTLAHRALEEILSDLRYLPGAEKA